MESPQVFRLTLANLHQLGSLSKYTPVSLNLTSTLNCYQLDKYCDYPSFTERIPSDYSLTLSSVASSYSSHQHSTSLFRSNYENEDVTAHRGSYVALRAFYAFGARSGLNCNAVRRSHSLCNRYRMNRSSRESSVQDSYSSTSTRRSYTPTMFESCRPSSSQILLSGEGRQIRNYELAAKRVVTPEPLIRREQTPVNSRFRPSIWDPVSSKSVSTLKVADATTATGSLNADELNELQMLREKNKKLEDEIRLLRQELEELKEREKILTKQIEESNANAESWKDKYERQKRISIEKNVRVIKENNNNGISEDLIEQLDNATEKLSRISATKDFQMLQNEIENALKEIQRRPVMT
uniref:Uncharacterized protein n=1 Tax=Syphacia muris TaxID=451379 RepID=A0A158R3Q7_9BILA